MLPSNATVEEKSLALAALMRWEMQPIVIPNVCAYDEWRKLRPYESCEVGRAQFADILLKFPEVMLSFCHIDIVDGDREVEMSSKYATQANLLDEILRMKGRME